MGNVLRAQVRIKGTRKLLWHAFGPDAIPLERQERTGVAGNDPEEWKKTVLALPSGQLYFPSTYVFGSIRDGARNVKKGRGSIQPAVASTLQVVEDIILVDRHLPAEPSADPTQPVFIDVTSVRNPSTKARNVRYRIATGPGWECSFGIEWDKIIVPRDQMRETLAFAGQLCGIGDGRNIGFGRYSVEEFAVSEL